MLRLDKHPPGSPGLSRELHFPCASFHAAGHKPEQSCGMVISVEHLWKCLDCKNLLRLGNPEKQCLVRGGPVRLSSSAAHPVHTGSLNWRAGAATGPVTLRSCVCDTMTKGREINATPKHTGKIRAASLSSMRCVIGLRQSIHCDK